MNLNTSFLAVSSIVRNILSEKKLFLLSEPANWAIYEDCQNIQKKLKKVLPVEISYIPFGLKNKIIHFASENTLIGTDKFKDRKWYEKIHRSNIIVLTWFHISKQDASRLHLIPFLNDRVDIVHTASQITKQKLIQYGLREEKIITVPLGIDLELFHSVLAKDKSKIQRSLRLPEDKFLIGSFQKDGNGWGAGLEPKLIKGPDILCDVVEKLAKKYPIHVILTGPARGYVKNRLKRANIPYTHVFLKNYTDVARYYQTLDMYLITSREEGGPKALLESLASGIPLITTRVGMAPELIEDGINGFLTEIEDVNEIFKKAEMLIGNQKLRSEVALNGIKTIQKYSLNKVAQEMRDKIYVPLLSHL